MLVSEVTTTLALVGILKDLTRAGLYHCGGCYQLSPIYARAVFFPRFLHCFFIDLYPEYFPQGVYFWLCETHPYDFVVLLDVWTAWLVVANGRVVIVDLVG